MWDTPELEATRIAVIGLGYVDNLVERVVRTFDQVGTADLTWNRDATDPASSNAPCRICDIGNERTVKLLHCIEVLEQDLGSKAGMQMVPLQAGDVSATEADMSAVVAGSIYRRSCRWRQASATSGVGINAGLAEMVNIPNPCACERPQPAFANPLIRTATA